MYAIVKTGGKQYKVAEGDVIEVEKLAGQHVLPTEALDAEPLRVGVAPVPGAGRTLLVSHIGAYFPLEMPVTLICVSG